MRLGLNLRVNLIVVPTVAAMLVLALAPIRSYLKLQAFLVDVRRELAFVLHLCRFDIQAVRQSVEYFGVALLGESAHELEEVAEGGRASLATLRKWEFAPRQSERLGRIEQAYARLTEAVERATELAQWGDYDQATRLFTKDIEKQRDDQLLPLVDSALIEGSLSLGKALDGLLATSAHLVLIPLVGIEADANLLRKEAAEAISIAKFARQAQRLLGEYRCLVFFDESGEELAVAEHEFDHAYMVWDAQVAARDGDEGAMTSASMADISAEYRAVKQAIGRFQRQAAKSELLHIYQSELEALGDESLPRVLTVAFDAYDARISNLLDSISLHSRVGGSVVAAVALLALGLATGCPWLISRWIVRPVLALTAAARELGAGGGGGPVSVRTGGEIAELATSFNRMSEQLAERTRELEAERARERLRHAERLASVGSLASGLSHQINNPVNNIVLTAEHALVEEGPDRERIWREALAGCADEARRCARIVRGLVAFSRGEPGQKWREDANQVLQRAWELTASAAAELEATVELHLSPEPTPILASSIALEQALVNVIRNGIQSRPRACVTLRTERLAEAVRIEVRDDGRGIDRGALRHLFDPFYTTRADEGGIGLGLSVAHRIIADHGGEISVDSQSGEGTTVTVELPLDFPGGGRG